MWNRKRNWILKRLVLGFAVAALFVPTVASAKIDQGGAVKSNDYVSGVTDFPSQAQVKAGDYGMPRAMPSDYVQANGDAIELVRLNPRSVARDNDTIENVRLQPRHGTPFVVASPGFDWGDAGIGAAVLLGIVLVGGAAYVSTRGISKPQTA